MNKISSNHKLFKAIQYAEALSSGAEKRLRNKDIKAQLDAIFLNHIYPVQTLSEDTHFVRGRKIVDHWDKTSDMGPRKKDTVLNFGRCHAPQQSVFYGSLNHETVFSELGSKTGDKVQTIQARVKQGEQVKYTVIGEIDHIRRHQMPTGLMKGSEEIINVLSNLDEIERLKVGYADAFISDMFRREGYREHEYIVTSLFSEIVFSEGFDAFMYPSVGHRGGWNIAVKDDVYREKFEVISSIVHDISGSFDYGMFTARRILESVAVNGDAFEWGKLSSMRYDSFDEFTLQELLKGMNRTLITVLFKQGQVNEELDINKKTPVRKILGDYLTGVAVNSVRLGFRFELLAYLSMIKDTFGDEWDYVLFFSVEGEVNKTEMVKLSQDYIQRLNAGEYLEAYICNMAGELVEFYQ